jgi:hypothetical protein
VHSEYINPDLIYFKKDIFSMTWKGGERKMSTCAVLERNMLPNPVRLQADKAKLDFNNARLLADEKAKEVLANPMLMSWYDRSTGRFSPDVTCCSEDKPGWVVYAESRGGNMSVTVNDEQYVFIYADLM